MTDTRSWWPEGYGDDPAFQVRRQIYGYVTGGDYVRGSGVLTLQHTALRFPTEVAGAAEAAGRAKLYVRVKDHGIFQQPIMEGSLQVGTRDIPIGTVEITWGWPSSIEQVWTDVALVRSAFGRPSTVNDGQTILSRHPRCVRAAGRRWEPRVRRGCHRPDDDRPADRAEIGCCRPGRWYHYGLFFKISQVEWIQGMVDSCLLPRDFGHADHLWNNIPPYYRWTDEQQLAGKGLLRQFLYVFGFELDTIREFVESWQNVYNADWSPIRLLRKLGQNFGLEYEQGVGDIRFRSLFSELGRFYEIRGTQVCLEGVIRRMSKYHTTVTPGSNLMLLPDDCDFYQSTGNWGGTSGFDGPGTPVHFMNVTLTKSTEAPPEGVGRGSMMLTTSKADVVNDVAISCAACYIHPPGQAWQGVDPDEGGIPINGGMSYGFSVWVKPAVAPVSLQLSLVWFDGHNELISISSGVIEPHSTTNWERFEIEGMFEPPEGAIYVVPYILFDVRTDSGAYTTAAPPVYIAGTMVYATPTLGEALGPPPNQYLSISDPGEPLGGALNFKGTLSGAATPLPTGAAEFDAWAIGTPVPTAIPRYLGITPDRAAAVGDAIYWNGTAWINIGATSSTFEPFLLGAPEAAAVTAVFTDFFRQQLYNSLDKTDPLDYAVNLMAGKSVHWVYFRTHAAFTDTQDPRYTGIKTISDLAGKTGWSPPLAPSSATQVVGTLTVNDNTYVIANNKFVNGGGWTTSTVSAAALVLEGTHGGTVDPIIYLTDTPFEGGVVMHQDDALIARPVPALAGSRSLFGWPVYFIPPLPATPPTTVQPVEGSVAVLLAPPTFEASYTQHAWLYPQRVNMIANPSFETNPGTNHWRTSGTIVHVAASPTVPSAPGGGAFYGKITGTAPLVAESNLFPIHHNAAVRDQWTIQAMIRGTGKVRRSAARVGGGLRCHRCRLG